MILTSMPSRSRTISLLLLMADTSGRERGRAFEHSLIELFEPTSEHAKVEPLQHQLLASLAEAIAYRRIFEKVQDLLGEPPGIAVGHDQTRLAIGQRQLDVFRLARNAGFAHGE